jgi:hypothetical protein
MNKKTLILKLEDELQSKIGYYGFLLNHYLTVDMREKADIMNNEIRCVIQHHNYIIEILKQHLGEDDD